MTQPLVYPGDAPFDTTSIPTGWDRPMTQAEADAANAQYPVPPYGDTYFPPGAPIAPPNTKFVILKNPESQGVNTVLEARPGDIPSLTVDTIFSFWPIAGIHGIVDDVGVRPARVLEVSGNDITVNYDSSGLDITGLILVGVVYIGPRT